MLSTAENLPVMALLAPFVMAADNPMKTNTSTRLHSASGCRGGENSLFDADYRTMDLVVHELDTPAKSSNELMCSKFSVSDPDWPKDEANGNFQVWVDTAGIAQGCKLQPYDINVEADEERACGTMTTVFGPIQSCVGIHLKPNFGYTWVIHHLSSQYYKLTPRSLTAIVAATYVNRWRSKTCSRSLLTLHGSELQYRQIYVKRR